jgi:hypothetical protein
MKFHKDKLEFQGWMVGKAQVREILSGRASRVVCECAACARESTTRDVASSRQAETLTTGCTTFSKDEVASIEKWLASKDGPSKPRARVTATKARGARSKSPARRRAGGR